MITGIQLLHQTKNRLQNVLHRLPTRLEIMLVADKLKAISREATQVSDEVLLKWVEDIEKGRC